MAGFANAECEISELPRAESGGRGRGFAARSMRKHQKKARPTKIKEGPQRPGSRSFFRRRRRRSWFVVLRWIQESRAHQWPSLGNRTRPVEISLWASERTKGAGETGALEKPRAEEESAPGKKRQGCSLLLRSLSLSFMLSSPAFGSETALSSASNERRMQISLHDSEKRWCLAPWQREP